MARKAGVVAGLDLAETAFRMLDPKVKFTRVVEDGGKVAAGAVIAVVQGATRALLTGERTALNFLGRLSGIATLTAAFVAAVEGTPAQHCQHAQDDAGAARLREIRGEGRRRGQSSLRAL